MVNVLKSEKREKFFLFSDLPYESLYPSMITRIDEKNINSFKKVKDETIALVKGHYSYDKVKKEYPNVKVLDTYNTFEMLEAVSRNEADIAYGLNTIVEYNINKHRLTNLKLTRNIDDNILHFYFAYNKENKLLKNLIRKAEKAISKQEIQALRDKWLKKINLTKQKSNSFLFTKNEIEYLDKKKTITMCVDPHFMPFEKVNEKGQYIGIIADFMNTLSKNTSIKFELLGKTSWRDTLNLMKNKKCDIIPFIVETNKRKEYINFTQSYLTLPLVIATKNSEMFITNLESIRHKKIALIKDFATIDLIKLKYPDINIVEVKNIKEGLTKVNNDEAYAYLDTLPNVVYSIQKDNFSDIRISGKTFMDMDVKIGVRNDEVILQNILNKAIKTLDEETKNNIINKWLTIVKDESFNMLLFIKIFSVVFLIFISIILFIIIRSNRSLSLVNKELEILSTTDKLTQINNRSKIDEIIQQEIDLSQRYNNDLCLIMADIDFFKKINDNYGHIRGDSVLKEFSNILSQNIRKTDFIGRWGGEEFMIVCPQTNKEHTFRLAEKLRKLVESYNFKKSIKITSSFGIYQYQQGDSLKTCIKHVDDALYEAKNSNRNCVKIFEAKEEN
ncbi:transporter substrate-binding domain-containing diguanylate cyclase, partial [Poseidonibacter sp.]|uniref:transporter substrate-binding domain-containing diguanylate cyclase n=1 Tax=Poseidonibacter sp. TaxID=2321188 RepID=UPI003C74B694